MKKLLLLIFISLSLTGCYIYDNSVDPYAKSYSGYNTVDSLNEISPVTSDLLDKAQLLSSKYKGLCTYEYQVKLTSTQSWEGIESYISDTNVINISNLNLLADTSYDWRIRGVLQDKTGFWSYINTFKTQNNIAENSRHDNSYCYLSDFIYISIGDLSWGKSWEVRYKIDNNEYLIAESDNSFIFIDDPKSSENIKYQIREKNSDTTGFWSEERQLDKSSISLNLNNVISEKTAYIIGSGNSDVDTPDTEISIPYGFAIGQYEITNSQFINVINESVKRNIGGLDIKTTGVYRGEDLLLYINDSITVKDGILTVEGSKENHPVTNITWNGAVIFTELLNSLEGWVNKAVYRLPYEVEWEYVASNGSTTIYPWGDDFLNSELNFNSIGTLPVGSYTVSSKFNCYDLSGNVWEWCLDSYSAFSYIYNSQNNLKSIRGGSWFDTDHDVFNRSYRSYINKEEYNNSVGLRVVFQYGK